jgi:hypothetical protein
VHDDIPYLNDSSIVCPATSISGPIALDADEEDVANVEVESNASDCENADPNLPERETQEMKLRKQAQSLEHLLTHLPQNPFCPVCRSAKLRKASAKKIPLEERRVAKVFGGRIHGDHVFPNDIKEEAKASDSCALALKDDSTEFRGFYPQPNKSAVETAASIRHFVGPDNKLTQLRTDNSPEFKKTVKMLKVHHEQSVPYRSESNARVERDIGVVCRGY